MRHGEALAAAALCLIGSCMILIVIPRQTTPGYGEIVSPGLLPTLAMSAATALSALWLIQALGRTMRKNRAGTSRDAISAAGPGGGRAALFILLLLVMVQVVQLAGLLAGGVLTVVAFMLFAGERRAFLMVPVAVGIVGTIHVLLGQILGIPLP